MPWYFYLAIMACLGTFFFWVQVIVKYSERKELSKDKKKDFEKRFKKIFHGDDSTKEKFIDCDKLFHKIFLELWYEWSFWEILKQEPNEIWDLDKVWELHKIRNKLVHDFDDIGEKTLEHKLSDYKKEIKFIL